MALSPRRLIPAILMLALLAVTLAWPALHAQEAGGAGASATPGNSLIFGDGETLWGVFLKAGWVMWCILAASVVGLTFFFERAIELRRTKHVPKDFDKDVVHAVDLRGPDAGLALCLEKSSSLARVLYSSLLRYGTSRQEMEAAIQDEGARLLYDLRRNCRVIGIMSNVAPLMGLLGTVLGLIEAFDKVAASGGQGMGKADVLAGGVAVALLTTAFGLIVAIPLLFMYHYVRGRADDLVREISERAVDAVITLDRKARRSIRQIEDVQENLDTKDMPAAKNTPNLDAHFQDEEDEEMGKATTVGPPVENQPLTPSKIMAALDDFDIDREGATQVDAKPINPADIAKAAQAAQDSNPSASAIAQPPQQIQVPVGEKPKTSGGPGEAAADAKAAPAEPDKQGPKQS